MILYSTPLSEYSLLTFFSFFFFLSLFFFKKKKEFFQIYHTSFFLSRIQMSKKKMGYHQTFVGVHPITSILLTIVSLLLHFGNSFVCPPGTRALCCLSNPFINPNSNKVYQHCQLCKKKLLLLLFFFLKKISFFFSHQPRFCPPPPPPPQPKPLSFQDCFYQLFTLCP